MPLISLKMEDLRALFRKKKIEGPMPRSKEAIISAIENAEDNTVDFIEHKPVKKTETMELLDVVEDLERKNEELAARIDMVSDGFSSIKVVARQDFVLRFANRLYRGTKNVSMYIAHVDLEEMLWRKVIRLN